MDNRTLLESGPALGNFLPTKNKITNQRARNCPKACLINEPVICFYF